MSIEIQMSADRIRQLICKCGDTGNMFPQFNHYSEPTAEESKEILRVWRSLPGNYSYYDALQVMLRYKDGLQ